MTGNGLTNTKKCLTKNIDNFYEHEVNEKPAYIATKLLQLAFCQLETRFKGSIYNENG